MVVHEIYIPHLILMFFYVINMSVQKERSTFFTALNLNVWKALSACNCRLSEKW